MGKLDKKKLKEKKRSEKKKKRTEEKLNKPLTKEQRQRGKIQIVIFVILAIIAAVFIVSNQA